MTTWEWYVTVFLWGFIFGICFYRGMRTGRWSLWP